MLNSKTNKRPGQFPCLAVKTMTLLFAILIAVGLNSGQAQNTWTQKADFGGTKREGAVTFSIEGKGYNNCISSNHNWRL